MKKWTKWLIAAAVIIAVIVCAVFYVKYVPVMTTILDIVVCALGIAIGWGAKWVWDRYFKEG